MELEQVAKCFRVLGDENRLKILTLLSGRRLCACDLLSELSISQGTLSHHMKQLTELNLVLCEREGKWCYYDLNERVNDELKTFLAELAPATSKTLCKEKLRIAFICVQNACRSQMAEAFAKKLLCDRFEVLSAGTDIAAEVNPRAVTLMKEHFGCDLSNNKPKTLQDIGSVDIAVTMGCGIACPAVFAPRHIAWDIKDPKDLDESSFLTVTQDIEAHVAALARELDCC